MNDLRQAAQQALKILELEGWGYPSPKTAEAITALRAALAEPVQEPVAWMLTGSHDIFHAADFKPDAESNQNGEWTPLYTAPPQRKPLTDEEIDRVTDQQWATNNHKPIYAAHRAYARAIERAHGIGGSE